jgi:uncharacterized protein YcbX
VPARDARVSELWIHPIKSCRGISVPEANVDAFGLENDRRYMIVADSGRFVTQRDAPALALVNVALAPDELRLSAPSASPVAVPRTLTDGERTAVVVWRSECEAIVEPTGSRWLSAHLGRPCRLVYMPDDVVRAVNPDRAPSGHRVGFQDGYPFLLVSEASLADISQRVGAPMAARRFRPNLVIRGFEPFEEDTVTELSIGELRFSNVKPCERCVVVTIDPETAEAGKEPLATLATYRRTDAGVTVGVNLIHHDRGRVRIGDAVVRTT